MEGSQQFQGNESAALSNLHDGRDGSGFRCFDPDQRKIANRPSKGQLHDSARLIRQIDPLPATKICHPDEPIEERLESDRSLGLCCNDFLGRGKPTRVPKFAVAGQRMGLRSRRFLGMLRSQEGH